MRTKKRPTDTTKTIILCNGLSNAFWLAVGFGDHPPGYLLRGIVDPGRYGIHPEFRDMADAGYRFVLLFDSTIDGALDSLHVGQELQSLGADVAVANWWRSFIDARAGLTDVLRWFEFEPEAMAEQLLGWADEAVPIDTWKKSVAGGSWAGCFDWAEVS